MKFIIMTPNRVIDKLDAVKVSAIGLEGSFSILPGHVDLLSVLVRCIVTASGENGSTSVYAADGGVLVKQDDQVMISTPMAVKGDPVSDSNPEMGITESIEKTLKKLKEESDQIKTETFRMETDLIRRMVELKGNL